MAKDYSPNIATALRLIGNFGASATIERTVADYAPASGEYSNATTSTTPATVVNLPASSGTVQAFDNRFREDVKKGKIRFFYLAASGLTFEPAPGDILIYQGDRLDIAGLTPLNPAGAPILYTLGAKVSSGGASSPSSGVHPNSILLIGGSGWVAIT